MMIARWNIDARFGKKQLVIDAVKAWCRDIGAQIGWTPDKLRVLSGAVGAPESAVVLEVAVEDLAASVRPGRSSPASPRTARGARSSSRTWSPAPPAGRCSGSSESGAGRPQPEHAPRARPASVRLTDVAQPLIAPARSMRGTIV